MKSLFTCILFLLPVIGFSQHDTVKVLPEFPGGQSALMTYIATNVKYPKEAQDCGCAGTVYVSFIIDTRGKVTKPYILKSPDICAYDHVNKKGKTVSIKSPKCIGGVRALEVEALRVVESLPDWKPGSLDGEPVRVQYSLPVKYILK